MEYYAGIDVSLEASSVCVVDASGKIVREAKIASDPQALALFFGELDCELTRIGIEACPLSQWLHAGLSAAGFSVVLLEVRHVKAAISAMAVKTDRNDARGIAQLLRMGWYRPVHCKSQPSQDVRALLTARKQLLVKAIDVELCLRGLLRGYGLKMGQTTRRSLRRPCSRTHIRPSCARTARRDDVACARYPAQGDRRVASSTPGDRAHRRCLPASDDRARRRRLDGVDLQNGGRRSYALHLVQAAGRTFWPDAEEVSVRHSRHHRLHHQGRRCDGA